MRARPLAAILLIAGAIFPAACAWWTSDLDDLTGGATDSGSLPTTDGAAEASAPGDAATTADAGPSCAGLHGPTPVAIDAGFCIDSTEVTVADYRAFRVAKDGDFAGQPSGCTWNRTWTPTIDNGADGDPVFGANWCQATAYCAWAGKRLCGLVPNGGTPNALQLDSVDDEWFYACTANGQQGYAYGNTYVQGNCKRSSVVVPGRPARSPPARAGTRASTISTATSGSGKRTATSPTAAATSTRPAPSAAARTRRATTRTAGSASTSRAIRTAAAAP